jgi:hypothetical protein
MRLPRRKSGRAPATARTPRSRPPQGSAAAPRSLAKTALSAAVDLAGIAREMLAWPTRLWLGAAEVAGEVVLAGWRSVVVPLLELLFRVLRAALRIAQREATPARGLAVVALAATIGLGASQFADYRAVEVGAPEYRGVENVAPAPQVDSKTPRSAHGISVFAIAVGSLFLTAFAVGRNWRLARMLVPLGVGAVAITLLVDMHQGLAEGNTGIAYQGANGVLLGGFWAQLFSAATLVVVGPLLAAQLRGTRERRRARPRSRTARGASSRSLAGGAGSSGVEGAAP